MSAVRYYIRRNLVLVSVSHALECQIIWGLGSLAMSTETTNILRLREGIRKEMQLKEQERNTIWREVFRISGGRNCLRIVSKGRLQ
jgi:hypothetical protein